MSTVTSLLGEGSFGLIHNVKTYDIVKKEHREEALKRNTKCNTVFFKTSLKEADILVKCKHPNIVNLIKVIDRDNVICDLPPLPSKFTDKKEIDDDIHFLLEKAIGDLDVLLGYIVEGQVGCDDLVPIFRDILIGTDYLQTKNIIHRDIKPNNILLFRSISRGGRCSYRAKLCDFSLSKFITVQEHNTPDQMTCIYRPPEMILGHDYGMKADMWSIGCVFYELLTLDILVTADVKSTNELTTEERMLLMKSICEAVPEPITREVTSYATISSSSLNISKTSPYRLTITRPMLQKIPFKARIEGIQKERGMKIFSRYRLEDACDLLTSLLRVNPERRTTCREALKNPMFIRYDRTLNVPNIPRHHEVRNVISTQDIPNRHHIRNVISTQDIPNRHHNVDNLTQDDIPQDVPAIDEAIRRHDNEVTESVAMIVFIYERQQMVSTIQTAYKRMNDWVTPRVIFHSINVIDLYLYNMYQESEKNGTINLDEDQVKLMVYSVLYAMTKYFKMFTFYQTIDEFVDTMFNDTVNDGDVDFIENMEHAIISKGLQYDIYHDTSFEHCNKKLNDEEIDTLLNFYLYFREDIDHLTVPHKSIADYFINVILPSSDRVTSMSQFNVSNEIQYHEGETYVETDQ